MVNPNEAGGGGEGNNNGANKGKEKMVFDELSDSSMDRDRDKDRDRDRDGFPLLPSIYYEKYERLAESLHKQLLLIKAWKERSMKEGKEKEESPAELEESTVEEERMKKIRAEISELKLVDSWEDMNVGRECVMCLILEKTVAFLPCAHLALCEDCNVLNQRLGMNDCPTCGTPIEKRIRVR